MDPQGKVVYRRRSFSTGSWSPPLVIESPGANESLGTPQITATTGDIAHVAWLQRSATTNVRFTQVGGTTPTAQPPVTVFAFPSNQTSLGWGFGAEGNPGPSHF